jgi:hypothetical protein
MKSVALGLSIAAVSCIVITEIARSLIHARRAKRNGLGGTQDIAMIGTFAAYAFGISALAGWIIYLIGK